MRRPVVVLVLLAILGLFACCAAGGSSWWKKKSTTSRQDQSGGSNTQWSNPPETPYHPDMSNIPQTTEVRPPYRIIYDLKVAATEENFRDTVQQHTGQHRSTNFDQSNHPQDESPYLPDMSNIPQSTNFDQSHPNMSNIPQNTNFNPSHHPYPHMLNIPQSTNFDQSHYPYPGMSNIPQSTDFDQSHYPYPDMSNIPQSTNFTQHASHYDQGMSSTVQPKKTKAKRIRPSKKAPTTVINVPEQSNFGNFVQHYTAMPEQSTTTAGGGSTQWTNPAGLNQSQYDLAPLPEQFPAMSQNFQSQQPDGGWYNSSSSFFDPNYPNH